jgi:hypothetical protein
MRGPNPQPSLPLQGAPPPNLRFIEVRFLGVVIAVLLVRGVTPTVWRSPQP